MTKGFVTGSPIEAIELNRKFPEVRTFVGGVGTSIPLEFKSTAEWGSPLVLLSLSRIAPKKRIDLCIEAVSHLRLKGVDARLEIVGSGEESLVSSLEELAKSLGVQDSITFHGQLTGVDKSEMYLKSDIFLLPSDDENFGIGLSEALAHGLPCVASSGVASAALMTQQVGRVIESPTGETVANAVEDLFLTADAGEIHHEAHRCAEEAFSWENAGQHWMVALGSLAKTDTGA